MPSSFNPIDQKEYKEHKVFCTLDKMINFYKLLSFSVFSFLSHGVETLSGIDTYMFSSIQGTLESIKMILQNGRINDAYALLRKYYDSAIINIYSNAYLQDNFSENQLIVGKINNWLKGKDKLPEFKKMSEYIKTSEPLNDLNNVFYAHDIYIRIRDRCNNHTHYNFYYYALLNDNEIYMESRISALDALAQDLEKIFVLHLSYLFYLSDHYMASSDYRDALELGLTPEEDSQYFVAPFVQEAFTEFIEKDNKILADLIKQKTSMKLV